MTTATKSDRSRAHSKLVAMAVATTFVLVAAACGNASQKSSSSGGGSSAPSGTAAGGQVAVNETGVTSTQIRVGGVASVTNPLGGSYGDSFKGTQAYFNMINSQGGIYGRKLDLVAQVDDNAGNNRAAVQAADPGQRVAVLPVAVLLFTGANELVQANVPTFGWNINDEWGGTAAQPKLNMFGNAGSYLGSPTRRRCCRGSRWISTSTSSACSPTTWPSRPTAPPASRTASTSTAPPPTPRSGSPTRRCPSAPPTCRSRSRR